MTDENRVQSRRKGGRPKSKNPRTVSISVALTPDERDRIQERANGQVAPFIRDCALGRKLKIPREVPELNRTAWTLLAPLASNLNQLSAAQNSGHNIEVDKLAQLIEQTRDLLALVRAGLLGRELG